jgi:hypothetical protein
MIAKTLGRNGFWQKSCGNDSKTGRWLCTEIMQKMSFA